MNEYNEKNIKGYKISVSTGVIEYSNDLDLETYLNLADNEMYKNKAKFYK